MVGLPGLEPGTSSLSVTRSNQLSYKPASGGIPTDTRLYHQHLFVTQPGGASGTRTLDPLLAKQVL